MNRGVPERYLRAKEVAKILGVSWRTVKRYTTSGQLISYRPTPKLRLYREDDVIRFVEGGHLRARRKPPIPFTLIGRP
ncbi:MAG TPA: helix-turn-helix domain-containing protein [Candidatus Hypogeohydataceae bacterium YC38]